MGNQDAAITELEVIVQAMRRLGVVKYRDIELGPEPGTSPVEDATQRSQELGRMKQEREQRLRFGASGGPRWSPDGSGPARRQVG